MATTVDRVPGIPRWVGARTRVDHTPSRDGVAPILVSIEVLPVRGFLWGLWLLAARNPFLTDQKTR